jgi:hypothetical protein
VQWSTLNDAAGEFVHLDLREVVCIVILTACVVQGYHRLGGSTPLTPEAVWDLWLHVDLPETDIGSLFKFTVPLLGDIRDQWLLLDLTQ